MRNYILFTLSFIIAFTLNLQANQTSDGSTKKKNTVSWNETSWDFGTLERNKAAEHEFVFINTADAPVLISKVKSSCGCTVSSYDKSPILPGKEGTVTVTYNAKKAGHFTKTVSVKLNDSENQVLRIKGKVKE